MREAFKSINFKNSSKVLIAKANAIIEDLQAKGYTLTLRQLFYQLVSRDLIANRQTEYKRLGSIINDARLGGYIDWAAIEDRTRGIRSVPHWQDPSEIIGSAANSMRIDKWDDQDYRIEVWVEKDALVGVLEKACRPLDVAWFSCRGYTSQTAMYDTGKRLGRYIYAGQTPVIIHLGDHDPSGVHMTQDVMERIEMFAGAPIDIHRIALNWPQIEEYNPPPNPAKETDSRFAKYAEQYGDESWELDALDPQIIDQLITDKILSFRDDDKWEKRVKEENGMRANLEHASREWENVEEFLKNGIEEHPEKPIFDKSKKPKKQKPRRKK